MGCGPSSTSAAVVAGAPRKPDAVATPTQVSVEVTETAKGDASKPTSAGVASAIEAVLTLSSKIGFELRMVKREIGLARDEMKDDLDDIGKGLREMRATLEILTYRSGLHHGGDTRAPSTGLVQV